MKLFEFAFCPFFNEKIRSLSVLCPEKWSFGANSDNMILKNYIDHTFMKLQEEDKVIERDRYAVFNTGLFTRYYQQIFAYFKRNKNPERQKWTLDGFYTDYQLGLCGVTEFPKRANYFSHPEEMVFNTNYEIIPQYNHIFEDVENFFRIPQSIRESSNRTSLFDGAIKQARLMIDANYKTAVPQYYKGRIQLLIPICLVGDSVPDLALVVSKRPQDTQYLGHTCLTLDMAYNNARLIARPDSNWLKP